MLVVGLVEANGFIKLLIALEVFEDMSLLLYWVRFNL